MGKQRCSPELPSLAKQHLSHYRVKLCELREYKWNEYVTIAVESQFKQLRSSPKKVLLEHCSPNADFRAIWFTAMVTYSFHLLNWNTQKLHVEEVAHGIMCWSPQRMIGKEEQGNRNLVTTEWYFYCLSSDARVASMTIFFFFTTQSPFLFHIQVTWLALRNFWSTARMVRCACQEGGHQPTVPLKKAAWQYCRLLWRMELVWWRKITLETRLNEWLRFTVTRSVCFSLNGTRVKGRKPGMFRESWRLFGGFVVYKSNEKRPEISLPRGRGARLHILYTRVCWSDPKVGFRFVYQNIDKLFTSALLMALLWVRVYGAERENFSP